MTTRTRPVPFAGKDPTERELGPPPKHFSPHASAEPRTERIDFRLTVAEKTTLLAKAKAQRRTITSLFAEFIENLGKEKGPG